MIKYLDDKSELRGASERDRAEAREWIARFWDKDVDDRFGRIDGEAR